MRGEGSFMALILVRDWRASHRREKYSQMMLMLMLKMPKMLMPLAGRPTISWTHLASEPEPTKFRVQSHKTSKLSFQNQIQTSQRRQSQQRWVFECFWRLCIFVGNCLVSFWRQDARRREQLLICRPCPTQFWLYSNKCNISNRERALDKLLHSFRTLDFGLYVH